MYSKRHVEELRDLLVVLKADAPMLYRYGCLGSVSGVFGTLSEDDRCRLVALGLHSGDEDVRQVARHLMSRLRPASESEMHVLVSLSEADRYEIAACYSPGVMAEKSPGLDRRIQRELTRAAELLKGDRLESAFWIMLPENEDLEAHWVEGVSTGAGALATLRSAGEFVYTPSAEQRCELFSLMRQSSLVLHVHNHPGARFEPSDGGAGWPSQNDINFARYWRDQRPELSQKMRFYIVTSSLVIEYGQDRDVSSNI